MSAEYNTFKVQYKRTPFDDIRDMNVFATCEKDARKTIADMEGKSAIIYYCKPLP